MQREGLIWVVASSKALHFELSSKWKFGKAYEEAVGWEKPCNSSWNMTWFGAKKMAPVKEIMHNFELGCANFQLITLLQKKKYISGEKKCLKSIPL